MSQLKIEVKYEALLGISEIVQKHINLLRDSLEFAESIDMDRLLIAALEEFWLELEKKKDRHKYKPQRNWKINITPVTGFALRECFAGLMDRTDYTANNISLMCEEIDRVYS